MGIIQGIMDDYENLIKTRYTIPLSNGDCIDFTFNRQDLPHLIGLQYLVDIPVLFEYKNERLPATDLIKMMYSGTVDIESFEKSIYFEELYRKRIQYFSSEMIENIIRSKLIVKFKPENIKLFSTKMDKIEYMFWTKISDNNNNSFGYLGIGFMSTGKTEDRNYPNTFFFRTDNQYIINQTAVIPLSIMIRDKYKKCKFEI